MASVRKLKKEVNNMVFDVVEECYSIQLYNPSKKEVTDKFIDEAADYLIHTLSRINSASAKEDFNVIIKDVETTADQWLDKLNSLN
jgi:hypothetical protein